MSEEQREKLTALIEQAVGWLRFYRQDRRKYTIDANMTAIRIHALLDVYKTFGGDTSKWLTDSGTLRRDL